MIFPFNAGEVFKIALKIEDNGKLFYEKMAAQPFPDAVRQLFQNLAKEELGHKAIFQKFLNDLPPSAAAATVWDPDNELDQYLKMMADQHVFNRPAAELEKMLAGLAGYREAVELAMGFERDSIVFFLEMTEAADNDESRAWIGHLVDEERKHLRRLIEVSKKIDS